MIRIKRTYEVLESDEEHAKAFKILVDRLWPRGLSKDKLKIDLWLRDVAPSTALRKWFAHDPQKWQSFKLKYKQELKNKSELLQQIKELEKEKGQLILLYSAKDEEHNDAVVLRDILNGIKLSPKS
jgi:uncharacterized protein YeaO (DUF488 family)